MPVSRHSRAFELLLLPLSNGTFAYVSEIMPTKIRGQATSLCSCAYWLGSIIWLQSASTGITNVGWKYFLPFIFWTAIWINVIIFVFPETKGKTLEEISAIFGDEVAVHWKDANAGQLRELEAAIRGQDRSEKLDVEHYEDK